jgi:hypothetical protein
MQKSKYKRIRLPDGTTKDEHRIVMERYLGRPLTSIEVIHHHNGNPRDNRLENLQILSREAHARYHNPVPWGGSGADSRKVGLEGTAWCVNCKTFHPIEEFWKNRAQWNGLQKSCKKTHHNSRKRKREVH